MTVVARLQADATAEGQALGLEGYEEGKECCC